MNFKELAENIGLEEEEYLELIELFIETGISDLDKLQSAIEEGNPEKAANAAHSIKGASSNLGLMELYEVARKIEKQTRNDRLEGIAQSAQELKGKLDIIAEHARGSEEEEKIENCVEN
jgi:HPt (histidine-containing phosphotransfer) domain-containing protein